MKINLKNFSLNIYLSLFIFCMINREFLLFGLDLRFILFPLGLLLIINYMIKNHGIIYVYKNQHYKQVKYLLLFYSWVFICNISWLWNDLAIDKIKFINELILIANILISVIVLWLYEDKISPTFIKKNIVISAIVLVISLILVGAGFSASQISASLDQPIKYTSVNGIIHTNLFGWNFRPSGYASDPNYATVLMLIAYCAVSNLNIKNKKFCKFIFLFGIALAFSKTILVAAFFSVLYIFYLRTIVKDRQKSIMITKFILLILIVISMVVPFIPYFREALPETLTIRFTLWERAMNLFRKSPIIGNGITSFRSYNAIWNNWYVHSHNTYLQILSECGIVGLILFYRLMKNTITINYENKINFFMTIVFMFFMLTYETIALQFFTYVVMLCQIQEKRET